MSDLRKYPAVKPTRLSSAATSSQTTLTVAEIKDRYSNALTMTDFGSTIGYGVISPGKSAEEQFTFTGISGSQLTGVTRGVEMKAPYGSSSSLARAHAAGEIVIIYTNSPAFYDSFVNKANDESITGIHTYSASAMARADGAVTYGVGTEEYIATKRYVDGVALVSSPDASTTQKGVVEEGTQAQVDARTTLGETSARLFVNPSTVRAAAHHDYAADAGASDAYAITVTPAITAYATGQRFIYKANTANTGTATLAVNGLAAVTIVKNLNTTLADSDIKAGQIVEVVYDGTNMQLVSPVNMDEAQTFFGLTDITGTEAESLTANGDAVGLHYHREVDLFERVNVANSRALQAFITSAQLTSTATGGSLAATGGAVTSITTASTLNNFYVARVTSADIIDWTDPQTLVMQFSLSSITNQDVAFGLGADTAVPVDATYTTRHAAFLIQDGTLYASCADGTTQTRSTAITATLTNFNTYKIVFTSSSVTFHLNGTLVATITTTIPTGSSSYGSFFMAIATREAAAKLIYSSCIMGVFYGVPSP